MNEVLHFSNQLSKRKRRLKRKSCLVLHLLSTRVAIIKKIYNDRSKISAINDEKVMSNFTDKITVVTEIKIELQRELLQNKNQVQELIHEMSEKGELVNTLKEKR